MKRQRPEDILQQSIVATLRALLPKGWLVAHVPNGGKRSKAEAARFKAMGVLAGFPDLMVIGPQHKVLFMELKAPPKRLKSGAESRAKAATTDAQDAVLGTLESAGWPVAVVRTVDEALAFLKAHGVETRGRVQ